MPISVTFVSDSKNELTLWNGRDTFPARGHAVQFSFETGPKTASYHVTHFGFDGGDEGRSSAMSKAQLFAGLRDFPVRQQVKTALGARNAAGLYAAIEKLVM